MTERDEPYVLDVDEAADAYADCMGLRLGEPRSKSVAAFRRMIEAVRQEERRRVQHAWKHEGETLTPLCGDADAATVAVEDSNATPMCPRCYRLALKRARQEERKKVLPLIRDLTDPEECRFDHRGGCQVHGYLTLKPGELCPHEAAKQWIKTQQKGQTT